MTNALGVRQGHRVLHPFVLYPPLDDFSLRGCIDIAEITSQFLSLPLNSRWQFATHVIHHPIKSTNFIDDAIGYLAE
jgi:hypothetical protein